MAFVCKLTDTNGVTGPVASGIYGSCATAAATAAKVVTLAELDKLIVGCVIYVKFTYENTASSPTLNVNSLGAKAIRSYGTTAAGNNNIASWCAGEIVGFMYDETTSGSTTTGYWHIVSQTHSIFTTTSVGSASAGTAITASLVTEGTATTASKVTLGTSLSASKVTLGTAIPADDITAWNAGGLPSLKWVSSTASKVSITDVSIPNVTGNTSVSIPNVTGNTDVTVASVKTINNAVLTAVINEGILTFTSGASVVTESKTASKVTLGTALSASKVTLGTALAASKVTASDVNVSYLGTSSETTPAWDAGSLPSLTYTAKTIPNVTGNTTVTIPNVTAATDVTVPNYTITEKTIPNISVSSKTVIAAR